MSEVIRARTARILIILLVATGAFAANALTTAHGSAADTPPPSETHNTPWG
ncbi:hypothetical protein [Nonomuraea sp. 10N515B]|uniref:hypothetical protein n=1 Tax=Nonomuraea sp. 10N515B TaxID=3457422 RepID=UPI003FCD2674